MKKNNQAKSYFSYKADEPELVEISQFIRDITDYRVEHDWYVILETLTGEYIDYTDKVVNNIANSDNELNGRKYKFRWSDILIIDKKTNKLKLIVEIDGGIHDVKIKNTNIRNDDYTNAGLPFVVIDKHEIETTIFDLVYKKIEEKLG